MQHGLCVDKGFQTLEGSFSLVGSICWHDAVGLFRLYSPFCHTDPNGYIDPHLYFHANFNKHPDANPDLYPDSHPDHHADPNHHTDCNHYAHAYYHPQPHI